MLRSVGARVVRALAILAAFAAAPALAADLQISGYSWVPDPVPNGAATVFTVRATNNGPETIDDAVVTVGISNRFRVDPGNFPAFCNLAGAVGSQTLTCNLSAFGVGDRTFQYTATAIATGSVNTTATISSVSANDPNAANNSLTVTPAVQNGANLATVKTDQLPGGQIAAGGTINYRIDVTNGGPDATNAISLTDNLPPASDFLYQSAAGTNWICNQGGITVNCSYTGPALTGALPPVIVTGRVTRATAGTITNNAFASLTSPLVLDPNGANNASPPVVTTIIDGSDLRAAKTMPTTIVQGTTVNIDITLFNDGPQSVTDATLVDNISVNFSIGALPAGCSRAGQQVTCNAGVLAANTNRAFSIPVTALNVTPANQVNSATIGLPPGFNDANLGNNTANATYRIVAPTADLSLTKTKTPNPVQAGQNMVSTITVRNNGPAVLTYDPATPLRVTDTVSADESYVSNGAGFSCAQVAAVITCATTGSGTIAVNGTLVLSLTTQASATANSNLVNTACTGTTGGSAALPLDTNTANDCSNATSRATTVTTDLAIIKEVSLDAAGPWTQSPAINVLGGANSYFIRFTAHNLGAADADTVTVRDTLPNALNTGGFVTGFAQVSVTTGTTSYTPASGLVMWNFSNLVAGGSQQAIVRIDRPFNNGNNLTNTATISSPDTIDTNAANNSSSALLTVQPLADIAVTDKSISPNPARIGVVSTYTIAVRNNGANNASGVVLTDTIDPARFTLVGNPATTKPAATCTKNDATGQVSCNLGAFARNQSFQVTQSVRPRFPFGGIISGFPVNHDNTASVTTVTVDSNPGNNSFTLTHPVTAPGFDLAITKVEPGPEFDPLRFGDELVYDVRVSNFGPSLATNVVLTDIPQPPAGYTMTLAGFSVNPVAANGGLTLYTPPAPNCATVGANVECRLDAGNPANNNLDALNQVIFRLRFTPGGPAPTGTLTFTDTVQVVALEQDNVTTNQADQQLANNQATQTTTVLPSTDLEVVSKTTVTASPAQINQPIQYSIVIRNNGVSPTTQVRVTDQLPAGFVLTGPAPSAVAAGTASVSGIACTGANTVLCVLDGSFPEDGSTVTITLTARADYPYAGPLNADQPNTAMIAPGQSGGVDLSRDSDPTNNSKSSVVQITASSLAGLAYADDNGNGAPNAGEFLPGVTVTLTGTDAFGNVLPPRVLTTDAGGAFLFANLPAGTYTIVETQPAGLTDGRETAGTAGGTVNNASFGGGAATNTIGAITLPASTAATGYIFQELRDATTASIAGRVYLDPERDGADNNESGIAGVTIVLRQNGAVVATTTTGPDGRYRFDSLPVGSYTVEEQQPAGYGSSTPDSRAVSVAAGQTATADFGDTVSTLAGSVFLDTNNDGVRQASETGIAGVTVTLTGTTAGGQPVTFTQTTDATGAYRFTGLLAGTYAVSETQPAGIGDGQDAVGTAGGTLGNDTVTGIALPVGIDATGYTFGEVGQPLSGIVYVDTNRDGTRNPGEPGIGGVTVQLQRPDGTVVASTTTAADGSYTFPAVGAGDYVIVETQPAGYGNAAENAANRAPVTVGAQPVPPINFGETTGSIAGLVYNDTNNNGLRDPGEPPIAGVTLTLGGTDARGNPVTGTATSGADGGYIFNNIPGGTYTVTETQPANYGDGLDRAGTAGGTAANPGDAISGIALGPAQAATGYLFGERGAGARVSGHVWMDADHDRVFDPGEVPQAGWIVELVQGGLVVQTVNTDAAGLYVFTNVPPGSGYTIRFRNPENGALFGSARPNETGAPVTEGVVSPGNPAGARTSGGVLSGLTIPPGADIVQQSLPLDPAGIVYDAIKRTPVPGASVRITGPAGFDPATQLLGGAANATQIVGTSGIYQFLLLAGAPGGTYNLIVTPPSGGGYNPVPSALIPPCAGALAVGPTPDPLLVSTFDNPPPTTAPASCTPNGATTAYFFAFILTPGVSANVVNNHIPLDPILSGAILVTKSTPLLTVTRGGLVPYTVTARNSLGAALNNVTITDRLPAGFAYRAGSATIDGVPATPVQNGRVLNFSGQTFAANQTRTLKLILVVGAGVGEGEHVNQAFAVNPMIGGTISNIAEAAVRLLPDPDFDCTDVLGKVWDDANMNGTQDTGERGLPGVRLATVNGLLITTDAEGRYHITCPMIPDEDRGSNFIAKLDERTLPTGYRMTTGNPETVRMTRGKFVTLNFGAALGRVVRLDLNGTAFDGDTLKPEFEAKLDALVTTLSERPSVLRLGYATHGEDGRQAERRLSAVKAAVERRWRADKDRYRLIVETEAGVRP